MMKLIEITKNGKIIETGLGNHGITNPVNINFVIDEEDYKKLENITKEYKWTIYDALSMFCEYSEQLIPEMEYSEEFHENI